jgi:hypothetical protein
MPFYKTPPLPQWASETLQRWANKFADMRLFNQKTLATLAMAGQLAIGTQAEKTDFDVFQYIDPLIGTANGGRRSKIALGTRI